MYNLLNKYINSLTKEKVAEFAHKNNISLNDNEVLFTYNIIKSKWQDILHNPNIIDNYKDNYNHDNFLKIKNLFIEYYNKYNYLLK